MRIYSFLSKYDHCPSLGFSSRLSHLFEYILAIVDFHPGYHVILRLGLHHCVHQLQLSLCDLDDLLDESGPDLVLKLLDPVELSILALSAVNK